MRLTLPLTGTVLVEGSVWGAGDLVGDDRDPVRPVAIDLGNVSWTMVDVDLDNEVMVIEVSPGDAVGSRLATRGEKVGFLDHARDLIEGHTVDELYALSKCARLKRPAKVRK